MANYTIDDIEILRRKSGITYEEAVNLLEYHNGSLTRSLVDLERNGRIKEEGPTRGANTQQTGLKKLFNTMYRIRVMVRYEGKVIANLSSLFVVATLVCAPHVALIGLIVSLVLGYRISVDRDNPVFAGDTFDSMVETAKANVQGFSRNFRAEEPPQADESYTSGAASGTRPVNVQFPKGTQVDVRDEGDGYHEADIG